MSAPGLIPDPVYLYRIIHIDNLGYILANGRLTSASHPFRDTDYVNIGDPSLMHHRSEIGIPKAPGGTFNDYVFFYFGPRSPMLYCIYHGNENVRKRPQSEIIHLVTTFDRIHRNGLKYVYFDGHGRHSFSECFNTPEGLESIDWDAVKAKQWNETLEDPDRKRRKQAELGVHLEFPTSLLHGIGVYNKQVMEHVSRTLKAVNADYRVIVNENWYY